MLWFMQTYLVSTVGSYLGLLWLKLYCVYVTIRSEQLATGVTETLEYVYNHAQSYM